MAQEQLEKYVIGCLLIDGDAGMTLASEFGVDDSWFTSSYKDIWRAISKRHLAREPIDLVTVDIQLQRDKVTLPDTHYLEECMGYAVTFSHLRWYLCQLRNVREYRRAVEFANANAAQLGTIHTEELRAAVNAIKEGWKGIGIEDEHMARSLSEEVEHTIREWEEQDYEKQSLSWPTPSTTFQIGRITDELIFLVAHESVGKTAFALQTALVNARAGHPVSVKSIESNRQKVGMRLVSMLSKVNTLKLKSRTASTEEIEQAKQAARELSSIPLWISDTGASMDQLYAWAVTQKAEGAQLLIVDNMRHIRPMKRYDSPVEQFRDFSVRLKWIRDDTHLPLIILHHSSAQDDVAWSRDIRRDADILMFLKRDSSEPHFDARFNAHSCRNVEVKIDKHRDGPGGTSIPTIFIGDYQTFADVPQAQEIHDDQDL